MIPQKIIIFIDFDGTITKEDVGESIFRNFGDKFILDKIIDDLLNGMEKMMNNNDNFIGPVNLGNPDEFTMLELAKKVLELIPESKSQIVYQNLPDDDPTRRRPDITLAKEKLDWEPKIKLSEGLVKTIAYFRTKI